MLFTYIPSVICVCMSAGCFMSVPFLFQMPRAVWADAKCEPPTLDPPLSSHSAHCPLSALNEPPPQLHLMAYLILIETELVLEVKYIFMLCDNPFIKRRCKAS